MNREEIIRMARDAGSIDSDEVIETVFAAFAAAEREACAKVCFEMYLEGDMNTGLAADLIRAMGQA